MLRVTSVTKFVALPAGVQRRDTKSIPEQIAMVVVAQDKPSPEVVAGVDSMIVARRAKAQSLSDPSGLMLTVEDMVLWQTCLPTT